MPVYSYQKTEPGKWTVGIFSEDGIWKPESDWNTAEEAAERTHWLNCKGKITQTDNPPPFANGSIPQPLH